MKEQIPKMKDGLHKVSRSSISILFHHLLYYQICEQHGLMMT